MSMAKSDPGPLSLNTATVKERWGLAECIEGCARHGIPGISPWRDVLQAMGVEEAARQIRDAGLTVTGLCRGGMFTAPDAAGRAAAIEDNRRAIAEAHAIGAACLVMVCGGLPPGSRDLPGAREMVREGLHAIMGEARDAGVTIALEPLHPMTCADRSVLATLGQALDLCEELGRGSGVALDVYHVWWDPDLARQMRRARGRIAAFHTCDWLVPTTDTVFDRGLPGDGVIDIPAIRAMAEEAGWPGGAEVEILSRRWWARDPDEVLPLLKERHQSAC
ncbi:3-dehydroshikimate dehydratase [Roseomonas mucosa]|uniref:Hydroxypyruvate isomerase n=2 Tax=Roseomonas mucosa TaxID=207340 RepID=A0A379N073_9PROT|nr:MULTISPECIES: sugar phosphate isomerase/epimerase family protein [Roseomonas]ATR21341.1 sugar phosphate isomerase/epimerase [Roseomonas sp. FDAARGOS_362]AWV22061.1 3-dehydroshikimate dehydratase [Roseomonas mucosa]MCG7350663.1 sugar phosphate isomerase/epimerase [Roseomonas mucosa]MCG7357906.1 sugar phosphate isomerase/epimerase [Roseomonas mucosa]MDT8275182.1 sugar phosphate isomerase/epimerase family protein [Roseomonas mucosa]